jgi:transcriptional regulator GlxA family with amidase domain
MIKRDGQKNIVMLAFAGTQVLDVVGPLQMLAAVNDEVTAPAYRVTVLADRKGKLRTSGGLVLYADGDYAALPDKIDTLMVAGGNVDIALANAGLARAVKIGATRARRVVSICTGTFMLGLAGLLDGRRATTHWRSVDRLAAMFPRANVERDAIFVQDGRLWSSAGVTAGMDLALALVREDYGDEIALAVARRHVLFLMRPGGQSQFSAHLAPEAVARGKLATLLRWIPEHVGDDLDVAALASRANMSERNFARIFTKETGETPARYIERARVDAARRLLSATDLAVGQVAVRAGFGSEERMRRAFQRRLKVSPGAFRARFQFDGAKT